MPIQTNLQLRDGKNINVFTRFHLSLYLSEAHTTVTCGTMSLPINPGKVMVEPQPVSPAMTFLASKTLSPSSLPINPSPRPRVSHPITILATHTTLKSKYQAERGLEFETGDSFFRRESATGRDLGVLAASLHKKSNGSLRVLDAMCGCGVRSLRYLVEAEADFVLANDANDDYRRVVLSNLSRVGRGSGDKQRRWAATHFDANRVMTECYLQKDFFDLIDIDSFGSDSSFLRSAYNALKLGGLVYITSTDGYSSGGHRPQHHYGFISYCHQCGHSQAFSWDQLGRVTCPCSNSKVSSSLVLSGPLWTGPLHDATYVAEMLDLAEQWGWAGNGSTTMNLEKLLKLMIDESDPKLPFGYIKMDEVASRAKVNSPPLRTMLDVIHKEGYAVSRSHIAANAIKTNCPMSDCIRIAKELRRQLSAQM
ncbi:uncharacterized protein LOC131165516 isoform X4 [Malania oleifera]|uniref:uncharacterized protein LOC131165516 isoform X4 n=1 Tax=Malania oleifera TaxID=397392 RepID=UPI0025AE5D5C|nr:uncharacterized protein LOC131165516 isoform X4 [Malania oleifera]